MRRGSYERTTPAVARARERKARNRRARWEELKAEADKRDMSVHELQQEKYAEVRAIRRFGPSTRPTWL